MCARRSHVAATQRGHAERLEDARDVIAVAELPADLQALLEHRLRFVVAPREAALLPGGEQRTCACARPLACVGPIQRFGAQLQRELAAPAQEPVRRERVHEAQAELGPALRSSGMRDEEVLALEVELREPLGLLGTIERAAR